MSSCDVFHCQCAAVWTPSSALTNSVQSVESFLAAALSGCFGVRNEAAGDVNVEIDVEGVSTEPLVQTEFVRESKSTCSRSNSACTGMEKAMLAIESCARDDVPLPGGEIIPRRSLLNALARDSRDE